MYTPEQSANIQLLRGKMLAGTITQDELKIGLDLLRSARVGAHAASAVSRSRKGAASASKAVDSKALLDELDGLADLPQGGDEVTGS